MLFDNIDEKATIAKAKKVLKSYPRLDRMAKASYSLGSSGHYQDIKAKGVRTQTAQLVAFERVADFREIFPLFT